MYNAGVKSLVLFCTSLSLLSAQEIRLGIVGTDTSHVIAFTRLLNDPTSPDYVPGAKVVAAFKGGSRDISSSWDRVDGYAEELKTKWKVDLMPDIGALCRRVDAVLLESNDGRVHLEQAKQIIAAGKPLFIDKPMASTLDDAREIARLAKAAGVPWFSSSSLRWSPIVTSLKFDDMVGALTWGPGPTEKTQYLDLSWYGIHAVEMLYALMGIGCEEVSRTTTDGADVVVGRWKDGRVGMVRTGRPRSDYGAVVFRAGEVAQSRPKTPHSYRQLLVEVVKFFQTGEPPFPNEETLELFAFMDAAQRSKEAGGAPVKLR